MATFLTLCKNSIDGYNLQSIYFNIHRLNFNIAFIVYFLSGFKYKVKFNTIHHKSELMTNFMIK